MAKTTGMGSALWWGTAVLSGDVGSISAADTSRAVLDVTGLDLSAPERILGRRDGSLAFTSFWNKTGAHASLSTLPATDVQVTVAHGTPALGSVAASIIAIETTYGTQAGADGSLAATISASADGYPLEWGRLLTTGVQTFASGNINGASIDAADEDTAFSVDTRFGCAAYLHVFSLGSGDPIITIADSAANSVFLTLAPTAIVFSPTAAGTQRLQVGLTAIVRRYVRVQVTGTYTDLVCALNFVRYTESAA